MPSNNRKIRDEALANNNRTLQSYEACALQYSTSVSKDPSPQMKSVTKRMLKKVGKDAHILEIGSGPGWDADYIESLGATVHRTDATAAFRNFQIGRGKIIEPLNILTDDFGGPYDGVMALYVLQHISRSQIPQVLQKTADALRFGGIFLVCILEGKDELWQRGDVSGDYHIVFWREIDFVDALRTAGLEVIFTDRHVDNEGPWMTFLTQKKH